jgi:alkylresorcinol/alkylpyrone synthase
MPQDVARELAAAHFCTAIPQIERYLPIFRNSLVRERHFCVPAEWFREPHGLGEKNRIYLDWAKRLGVEAATRCLAAAGADPAEIDCIVFVSSSGIATPSIDVFIIDALGLDPHVRRVPVFGLGCGGGVAGLALADRLAAGRDDATILLVSVELNSITFQPGDLSKSNLVSTSLFGDGAAAVLIRSGDAGPLRIVGAETTLRKRSDRLMGWDFGDEGFGVVFSPRVPDVIAEMMPAGIEGALAAGGIGAADLRNLILHPGGRRILDAYQRVLGRPAEDMHASYDVLARYGNMSSTTVLFVLEAEMRDNRGEPGEYGLIAAFGPGFSAELSLLQWV